MKNSIFFFSLLLIVSLSLCSCSAQNKQSEEDVKSLDEVKPVLNSKLTLVWESDTLLTTVESVIYDSESNAIYTANINGHFMKKDGNGFVSKLDVNGDIIKLDWIKGLDAPTGLGIYEGKLYTTDIDKIIEVDVEKGEIINTYEVEGAKAFNDVAVGPDGTVYCSDTGGNQIFTLKNGVVDCLIKDIDTPNGLWVNEKDFFVTCWTPKSFNRLDLKTKTLQKIAGGLTGPDGIEAVGDGGYLVSGFDGLVHYVAEDGTKTLLLDTRAIKVQAADIDYIEAKKLLLVPAFTSNKIMAYQMSE